MVGRGMHLLKRLETKREQLEGWFCSFEIEGFSTHHLNPPTIVLNPIPHPNPLTQTPKTRTPEPRHQTPTSKPKTPNPKSHTPYPNLPTPNLKSSIGNIKNEINDRMRRVARLRAWRRRRRCLALLPLSLSIYPSMSLSLPPSRSLCLPLAPSLSYPLCPSTAAMLCRSG